MTALPPPTYYFNGITFNSAFYPQTATTTSSSGNGITEAQANLLYLRKTTADTATALETFTSGISTPSVDTSGNLLIGGNASTLAVSIGPTKNITIGALGTINSITIGASNRTVPITVGTAVFGANNITGLATTTDFKICDSLVEGNISIGEFQQGGKINIGTFSGRTTVGEINIGNNSGATAIPINIGGYGSITTINGTLSVPSTTNTTTLGVTGNTTLSNLSVTGNETITGNVIMNGTASTNYIQFPDGTKQYTAGGGGGGGTYVNFPTAQGELTIPSAIINTTLRATTSLLTPSLDSPVGTTNFNVGNYNATGTQSYGSGLSSGNLNIGILQSTGALNIGTGTGRTNTGGGTNGQINIGNGSTNAFGINIGGSGSTTAIGGELTASKNIVMNGTASTNYIQFPDGTKQYTAGGGGGGGTYVNYPTPQGALTALSVSGTLTTSTIDTPATGTLAIGGTNATASQAYAGALTTGTLAVASGQTTGAINIGCGTGRTNTDGGLGAINIGTGSANAFGINIGGSSSTTTINGTLSGLVMKTSSIDTPSSSYALEIGKTNASNSQSYAQALTTGPLNIAGAQTTGVINIGCASGRINTGGGTNGQINIGTGAGANAFGINIGGSGTTTTIGGNLAVTGTYSPASISTTGMITANGGLTLGGSNILTLSDGTVAPSTPSQQFGNYSIAFSGTTLPASGTSIGTVSIAQAGTYWVMWHYEISSTTSPPFPFYSSLTRSLTTNNTLNTNAVYGFVTGTATNPQRNCNFGQQIFTQTNNTATSYGLTINYSGGIANTQNSNGSFYRIFRIA